MKSDSDLAKMTMSSIILPFTPLMCPYESEQPFVADHFLIRQRVRNSIYVMKKIELTIVSRRRFSKLQPIAIRNAYKIFYNLSPQPNGACLPIHLAHQITNRIHAYTFTRLHVYASTPLF
jgi:hypothetical protein